MTPAEWLAFASTDVERRNLPELLPILESLARGITSLRAADWNDDASGRDTSHETDGHDR
jgi:hypothetical protein